MTKSNFDTPKVLLLGNYRPTLSVARAMKFGGFGTIVTHADDGAAGAKYSRFVDEIWQHAHCHNHQQFGREVLELLEKRKDIVAIFPIEEYYSIWLAQIQNQLPSHVLIASPAPETVMACLDKLNMLNLASRLNVPCTPYESVNTLSKLMNAAEQIGYPVIIRPYTQYNRIGKKKAVICESREELATQFPTWPKEQPGLLIQKYVRGDRHDLYFIAEHGKIKTFLETRITRTDSLDGTGLSTEGQYIDVTPSLADDTARMVAELGYHGVGFSQFIVDKSSNDMIFLELNPRVAGSNKCAEAVGLGLTDAALSLANGRDLAITREFKYPSPGYYCWLSGDLYGLKEALKSRELSIGSALRWAFGMGRSLLRSRTHLTWSWTDPKPAVLLLLRQTFRVFSTKSKTVATAKDVTLNAPYGMPDNGTALQR